MKKNITIIDYGSGNILSAKQSFARVINKENILAQTNYGINFPSIVKKKNIYGLQFHPEKSSIQGLDIIKSFIKL